MTRDRAELRTWYRGALGRRIDELRALRGPILAGEPRACDQARAIGQSLRGSGATFGFPAVTAVATLLETSPDSAVLRRLEGLIAELHVIATGGDDATEDADAAQPLHRDHLEWLLVAADLDPTSDLLDGADDMEEAWARVQRATGMGARTLAEAVGRYLDLESVSPDRADPSASRLIPQALVAAGAIVPIAEDARAITVASSEPTSLALEIELGRLTGRAVVFRVADPGSIAAALAGSEEDPAPEPARRQRVRPAMDHVDPRGRNVLVVDDEESARLMVSSFLERKGFGVVEAADGVQALRRLSEDPTVGLVVADLRMPNMDGLDLLWALRERENGATLPVVVVTGEVDPVLERQLLEEGADDYIRKPVDPRLLLARVEATIRRSEGIALAR